MTALWYYYNYTCCCPLLSPMQPTRGAGVAGFKNQVSKKKKEWSFTLQFIFLANSSFSEVAGNIPMKAQGLLKDSQGLSPCRAVLSGTVGVSAPLIGLFTHSIPLFPVALGDILFKYQSFPKVWLAPLGFLPYQNSTWANIYWIPFFKLTQFWNSTFAL